MNKKIEEEIKSVEIEILELTKAIKEYAKSLDPNSLDHTYSPLVAFEQKGVRLGVKLNELKVLKSKYR